MDASSQLPKNLLKDCSCHLKFGLYWEEADLHKESLDYMISNSLVTVRTFYDSDMLSKHIYPTKKLKEILSTNKIG